MGSCAGGGNLPVSRLGPNGLVPTAFSRAVVSLSCCLMRSSPCGCKLSAQETASEAEVKPGGYADDIHAVTKTVQGVKQVIGITCEYAGLSGQEVSHQKSSTFAVTLPQRKKLSGVKLDGHKLAVQSNVDILGFTLVMSQAKKGSTGKTAKATKGADKSKKRLQRLCYAPLHFEAKVCRNWRLVSSDLWPRRQTSSCRCFELSSQGGSARHRERCWQSFMCRSCFHALCQGS